MQNIRQGVFETNSSSSHSISISHHVTGMLDTIGVDDDGVIELTGGEFGWEEEVYNDALTKANYAAVDVLGDREKTQMLIDVIKKQTGAKEVIVTAQGNDWKTANYSYIDHQSQGVAYEAFESEETLRMFIFNPKSYLQTDNDNH